MFEAYSFFLLESLNRGNQVMEEIQLANLQENIYRIIDSVIRSHQSVLVSDRGKTLVKITPAAQCDQGTWLGCMRGKGKIKGDIIAPA